ncbi:MRN complex-interacting protein [Brachyistius frenatus]|uniref:MRN complex-interacting protein n=1 Tax=Brachyistius frenatus TaxID=100188 RepID=UPI0037E9623F
MAQEFHVVRCFSCQSFQVQQVKKVNRWCCNLCGEKQSMLKEFGRGSGADCRGRVQKLNAMRGTVMEEQERSSWSLWELAGEEEEEDQVSRPQVSHWNKYLDTPEENVLMNRQQLHGNSAIDRKRRRSEDQTDRGREERWTPEQKPQRSSTTTVPPSTVPPSTVPPSTVPPSTVPPSKKCDLVSRPRPLLPVSSMFESGEEFNFDDNDFLTHQRV